MNLTRQRKLYLSENACPPLLEYLSGRHYEINLITTDPSNKAITYPAVCTHADIFFCRMGAGENAEVFRGNPRELGYRYPHNVKFNGVYLDRYFIHNLKHTSPALLESARAKGLKWIHVAQGYTKCNMVVVDGHSVITADQGILRTLRRYPDINILPVRQGYVKLSGFEYGFLGGASGRVGNEIIFNGNLSCHPDFEKIRDFIENCGLSIQYFPEYELEDIGSIIAE